VRCLQSWGKRKWHQLHLWFVRRQHLHVYLRQRQRRIVSYATATAHVFHYARTLQACLHAPNGSRIGCTMYDVVEPGWTLKYTWAPHSYVTSGNYTAVTWRKNNDASSTEIGSVALLVQ
jgi:hypothetical protein